jgi:hypothetical protein
MAPLPRGPAQVGIALGLILAVTSTTLFVLFGASPAAETTSTSDPLANGTVTTTTMVATTVPGDTTTTTESVGPEPFHPWVDRRTVGRPWGFRRRGPAHVPGEPDQHLLRRGPGPG